MTRRIAVAVPLALALLVLGAGLVRGSNLWLETDARGLATGGASLSHRLDLSPGARVEPGSGLGFGMAHPYAGTGLVAGSVRGRFEARGWGAGASWSFLASPVHEEQQVALAFRGVRPGGRAGLSALASWQRFDGYASRTRTALRAGAGVQAQAFLDAVLILEVPFGGARASPRFGGAAEWRLGAELRLALESMHEPGAPAERSLGLSWRRDAWCASTGYDLAANAASIGLAWRGERRRVAWAARAHPELGWSQAWDVELDR